MSKRAAKDRLPPSPGPVIDLAPVELRKQEFARRLYELMIAKGWNQSDLARAAFGTRATKDGTMDAKGKDAVSSYITGRSLPTKSSLVALANALGVKPEELLPNTLKAQIANEAAALTIRVAHGHPDKVWIQLSRQVSPPTAARIQMILLEEDGYRLDDKK